MKPTSSSQLVANTSVQNSLPPYDLPATITALSIYRAALRELVHLSCYWLCLEPRVEVKFVLGDHIYDDAQAVEQLDRRLSQFGFARFLFDREDCEPQSFSLQLINKEISSFLDQANLAELSPDYLSVIYDGVKPALIRQLNHQINYLDPLIDQPTLELLTHLIFRQERHVAELAQFLPGRNSVNSDNDSDTDVSLPSIRTQNKVAPETGSHDGAERPGKQRVLAISEVPERTARDQYVETAQTKTILPITDAIAGATEFPISESLEDQRIFFHDLMHVSLCEAELAAIDSHANPDMPSEFHLRLTLEVANKVRHAAMCDRFMSVKLDAHWGDYPISDNIYAKLRSLSLDERSNRRLQTIEQKQSWIDSDKRAALKLGGHDDLVRLFDFMTVDN